MMRRRRHSAPGPCIQCAYFWMSASSTSFVAIVIAEPCRDAYLRLRPNVANAGEAGIVVAHPLLDPVG